MQWLVIIIGLVLLVGGALCWLVPASLWGALFKKGTRAANQTSVSMLFLFAGLLWLGCLLLAFYSIDVYGGWRSMQWRQVAATVESSGIENVRQIRSVNDAYRPQVTYRYAVDGTEYTGNRVNFGDVSTVDREWLQTEIATVLAPGAVIVAYVDPQNPAESTLQTGIEGKAVIFLVLGVFFIGFAGYYLAMLLRDWDGSKAAARMAKNAKVPYTHNGSKRRGKAKD